MRRQQPHVQSGEAVATLGVSALVNVDGKVGAADSGSRYAKLLELGEDAPAASFPKRGSQSEKRKRQLFTRKGRKVRKIIFVVTSCVAVSLAACSGVGTPAGGGPTTGEPTGGDGDGGTPSDSYNDAKKAVQSVLAEITEIEGLVVDTAAQKQAARVRIAAARMQYSEALAALRSAVEGLAAGSDDRAEAESYLRGVTLADIPGSLDAAEARAADVWANVQGPSAFNAAAQPRNAVFERFPRAKDDGTVIPASGRLSIPTKGVMYSAGKTVFSPDGTGTTDELPMRSLTIRSAGNPGIQGNWRIQGNDGSPPVYSTTAVAQNLGNTDGILNYSVQITAAGLVYKVGGNGIYYDFQRRFDHGPDADWWYGLGPDGEAGTADDGSGTGKWDGCFDKVVGATADCTNWIHDDVKVTFGTPSDADGVNAFFWLTRIPLPPGTSQDDPNVVAKVADHGSVPDPLDLGAYSLWISNYGGIERNREYSDGTRYPDDDEDRFLQYAAYGVLMYTDLFVSSRNTARQQGFHFGYDTFADQEGLKTTDIAADNVVEATFRGATLGIQALQTAGDVNGDGQFNNADRNNFSQTANRNEIRGDIVLNARIGSGANKISGEITNLEVLGDDGLWVTFVAALTAQGQRDGQQRMILTGDGLPERAGAGGYPDDYSAYAADIKADGSYEGAVYLQQKNAQGEWGTRGWDFDPWYTSYPSSNSIFGGTIYGPRDGNFENIETAGYWFLQGDRRRSAWGGIMGSFGAVRTD